MRKLFCFFLIFPLLMCGCNKNTPTQENTAVNTTAEIVSVPIEEDVAALYCEGPLEDFLTESYSIQELYAYFGPYTTVAENDWAGIPYQELYDYENVITAFPGGCLRRYATTNHLGEYYMVYSVFKVQEGGYFYVFWGSHLTGYDKGMGQKWLNSLSASDMLYVDRLKTLDDFSPLEIGVSTGEDVGQLDPAAQFQFGMGRGIASWHLLDDGSILEIMYAANDDFYANRSRKRIYVESMEIVPLEHSGSLLARCNPADLP